MMCPACGFSWVIGTRLKTDEPTTIRMRCRSCGQQWVWTPKCEFIQCKYCEGIDFASHPEGMVCWDCGAIYDLDGNVVWHANSN